MARSAASQVSTSLRLWCVPLLLVLWIGTSRVSAQTGALTGIGAFCAGKGSQKINGGWCNQYVQCSDDGTTGEIFTCPDGQLYSLQTGDCDAEDNVWCPTGQRGYWGMLMPSGGVVSIHCALVPMTSWVIAWQRGAAWWEEPPQPGMAIPGSELLNTQGMQWEQLTALQDPITNTYTAYTTEPPFCSGQSILPNGQILVCGGDHPNQSGRLGEESGLDVCRLFTCRGEGIGECVWELIPERMIARRWYPTQLQFPPYTAEHGHFTLMVGGSAVGQDPTGEGGDVEQYWTWVDQRIDAFYPFKQDKKMYTIEATDFTRRLGNMNMYVFMYLLPVRHWYKSYLMFWFGVNYGEIVEVLDPASMPEGESPLKVLKQVPALATADGQNVSVTYPAGACSVLHHLEYPWTDRSRITIFGGHAGTFEKFDDYKNLNAESLGLRDSWSIDLFNMSGGWEHEMMPDHATMRDCVLLPTGKVALVHGTRKGKMTATNNGAGCAKEQLYHAWLFDIDAPLGERYTQDSSAAPTWRAYHACALLLPDGSIYSAGCETGPVTDGEECTGPRNYHYQVDGYVPMGNYQGILDGTRPKIINPPTNLTLGTTVEIEYTGKVDECSLMTPGATTHLMNMSQRLAMMRTLRFAKLWNESTPEEPGTIVVQLPPDEVVIMEGPTLLYCLWRRRMYSEGAWVKLLPPAPAPAPSTPAGNTTAPATGNASVASSRP